MSCERMESRILSYVDGRLEKSERAEVQKHLDGCAACRVRVTEFSAVNDLLDELPILEPSPAFDVRVRARIAAEPVRQSWWAWLRPSPRTAFAASVLLLATVWLGYGSRNAPLPISPEEADAAIMQDLPVLEDHDTLTNFEPLKELPPPVEATKASDTDEQM